ncbi:beta-3-deoxy-D-manno-oct-2-ulosonic acid transferase [Sphingomonas sp. BN140010]|uniref:Beta-3-deoxy-D-manno-oct-2-ulosonic acid transferase n=1 Tax=Sphingomonas arvum TaxID=2992113 RepID=A0ABT3JC91_9SPHN|nr:beta-3-deoxy-D-manno-oct-2-ulosonic acid transferase [Sphingomonas sp. BN140010]MCW3796683.1 beta-3-deoxy-D-manno-oct-2-ulosonic acid transferase [Sphingomonas sp. BN140010]
MAGILGVPVGMQGDDGSLAAPRLLRAAEVRELLRERLLDDRQFIDPFSGAPVGAPAIAALCASWRRLIDSNRDLAGAFGFAPWKRKTTEALLWGGSAAVAFDPPAERLPPGSTAAIWVARTAPETIGALDRRGVSLVDVEDGFIRSAGLGANCVPPLSIVVDRLGAHFDARTESELERLLQESEFAPPLLERAEAVRREIVARGLSKYDVGQIAMERRGARRHILVPGQVEDDRAVLSTPGEPLANLAMLRQVRDAAPNSYLIYKPHPDVEAGHRKGAIPDDVARTLADEIVRDQSITSLIAMVDEVHVNSSLAGFEALLRDKAVTTYGVPFYAGWGLTTDRGVVPERRTAKRTLPELVAAALLLYPRYVDPVTGLPCSAEVVIWRLSEPGQMSGRSPLISLRRLQGRFKKAATSLLSRRR